MYIVLFKVAVESGKEDYKLGTRGILLLRELWDRVFRVKKSDFGAFFFFIYYFRGIFRLFLIMSSYPG